MHQPYKGVELSESGRFAAAAIIRRHRIVERFLADYLDYSWRDADRLATSFEHDLPQEVEDRIYSTLGRPDSCPHGMPIPAPNATFAPLPMLTLDEVPVGTEAVVALKGDIDTEMAQFLEQHGVRPGAVIELTDRQPFDGPLMVRLGADEFTLGSRVARNIHVQTDPSRANQGKEQLSK